MDVSVTFEAVPVDASSQHMVVISNVQILRSVAKRAVVRLHIRILSSNSVFVENILLPAGVSNMFFSLLSSRASAVDALMAVRAMLLIGFLSVSRWLCAM